MTIFLPTTQQNFAFQIKDMKQRKIVLVTGGSRGLGKDMALQLANKGLDIVLTYQHQKDQAEEVAASIRNIGQLAATIQLNVSESSRFDTFVTTLKATLEKEFQSSHIDYLVNNAGAGIYNYFPQTTEQQFDEMMNIHFKGPFFLTQKLLPVLNEGGGIVNIASGLTRFAIPGYAAYASMKGAMETLTKYQAKELGQRGIRVNIVAPGAIETDFGGGVVRDNKEMNQHIANATALGRVGLPEDIGGVVAFLCTDDARWVNAQRIEVSGGQMI